MRTPGLVCALLCLACGDIVTTAGDAAPSDGDGQPPDARAVGSIAVTVERLFGASQPLAGNQVLVVDTAGEVIADLLTDSGGSASADGVEAGSTLILLFAEPPTGAPAGSQAIVIFGLEPGDDIAIGAEPEEGLELGAMNVTWPSNATNNYEVSNGCSTGTTSDTISNLTYLEACVAGGQAGAMIRAVDGGGGTAGWIGDSTAFVVNGPLDVGGNWGTPRMLRVTLSDIPAEARAVRPSFSPARGAVQFNRVFLPEVELLESSVDIQVPTPRAFSDSTLVSLEFQSNQASSSLQSLASRLPPDETAVELALADELLPWYGSPVLEEAARTISWTRSSGREPDAQFISMFWREKGSASERFTLMVLPPDVTSVTAPELADTIEPFMPINPEQIGIQVQGGEASELDGYDAARQRGFALVLNQPVLGRDTPSTLRRSSSGDDF